jgi:hypothetical protein
MEIQISNEENYFIQRREEVNETLKLPTKSFLQNSYDFKKISALKNEPNFVMLIAGWCVQTSALMQIKNPIDQFVKKDIFTMLTGYWSILSFEELIKAFELERFGAYKEKTEHYQLFDCNYISQVLKKYQAWKRENKIELNISKEKEIQVVDQNEIQKIMIEAVNNKYNEYLLEGIISEPFIHVFKELVEQGKIKLSNVNTPKLEVYYQSKLEQARNEILKETQLYVSSDKSKRMSNKAIIQSIVSGIENEDAKAKIEIRAKKIVLTEFFKSEKDKLSIKIL